MASCHSLNEHMRPLGLDMSNALETTQQEFKLASQKGRPVPQRQVQTCDSVFGPGAGEGLYWTENSAGNQAVWLPSKKDP